MKRDDSLVVQAVRADDFPDVVSVTCAARTVRSTMRALLSADQSITIERGRCAVARRVARRVGLAAARCGDVSRGGDSQEARRCHRTDRRGMRPRYCGR